MSDADDDDDIQIGDQVRVVNDDGAVIPCVGIVQPVADIVYEKRGPRKGARIYMLGRRGETQLGFYRDQIERTELE